VDSGLGHDHAAVDWGVHDFSPPGSGGGQRRPACNMSDADRLGSMLGGTALTLYGVSRWRRGGWILAGFGVLLFRRGFTGRCFTYDLLGIDSRPRSTMLDTSHGGRSSDYIP
jgi:hypothetical protein